MAKNTNSVANRIRQLIKDGYTNKAIFTYLKDCAVLTDKQKHYPAWYRSELRRSGSFAGGNTRETINFRDEGRTVAGELQAKVDARRIAKNAAERARRAAKKLAA